MIVEGQHEVANFLADLATYGAGVRGVRRIDTHGAMVFLAGERAYKLKRADKFDYMDFSTLDRRKAMCDAMYSRTVSSRQTSSMRCSRTPLPNSKRRRIFSMIVAAPASSATCTAIFTYAISAWSTAGPRYSTPSSSMTHRQFATSGMFDPRTASYVFPSRDSLEGEGRPLPPT